MWGRNQRAATTKRRPRQRREKARTQNLVGKSSWCLLVFFGDPASRACLLGSVLFKPGRHMVDDEAVRQKGGRATFLNIFLLFLLFYQITLHSLALQFLSLLPFLVLVLYLILKNKRPFSATPRPRRPTTIRYPINKLIFQRHHTLIYPPLRTHVYPTAARRQGCRRHRRSDRYWSGESPFSLLLPLSSYSMSTHT